MTPTATFGRPRSVSFLALAIEAVSRFLSDAANAARRNGDLPYFGL